MSASMATKWMACAPMRAGLAKTMDSRPAGTAALGTASRWPSPWISQSVPIWRVDFGWGKSRQMLQAADPVQAHQGNSPYSILRSASRTKARPSKVSHNSVGLRPPSAGTGVAHGQATSSLMSDADTPPAGAAGLSQGKSKVGGFQSKQVPYWISSISISILVKKYFRLQYTQ